MCVFAYILTHMCIPFTPLLSYNPTQIVNSNKPYGKPIHKTSENQELYKPLSHTATGTIAKAH